jgi:hypothetical protein
MITPLRERVNVGDAPLAHLPFYQQSPQLANTRGVSLSPSAKNHFSTPIFLFSKIATPCPTTTSDPKSKFRKDYSCNWATSSAIFTFSD